MKKVATQSEYMGCLTFNYAHVYCPNIGTRHPRHFPDKKFTIPVILGVRRFSDMEGFQVSIVNFFPIVNGFQTCYDLG